MDFEYVQFELDGAAHVGRFIYQDEEDGMCCIECWGEEYMVAEEKLSKVEPCVVGMEDIRAFVRLEKMLSEIAPHEYFVTEYPYEITKEDILAFIANLRTKFTDDFLDDDYVYTNWSQYIFGNDTFIIEEDSLGREGLPDLSWYMMSLERVSQEFELYNIEDGVKNLFLPLSERVYEEEAMDDYVGIWMSRLSELDEEGLRIYRQFADELSEMRNEVGLRAVAYGCYGGNEAFDEDWDRSEECLLDLVTMYDDVFAANTLGYIYYYGRTNGGVPKYDEAFRYFTMGYTGGVYESAYKLADMFYQGRGVIKNVNRYFSMLTELEVQTREHLYLGMFDNKFADVALRLGSYWLKERNESLKAYEYFLLAEFAINRRMKAEDYYGDRKVKASIISELAKLRGTVTESSFHSVWENVLNSFLFGAVEKLGLDITKGAAPGEYHLSIYAPEGKLLLVLPEYGYCGFQERYEVTAFGDEDILTGSFELESPDDLYEYCFDEYVNVKPSRGKQLYAVEIGDVVLSSEEYVPNAMEVFQDEVVIEDYTE